MFLAGEVLGPIFLTAEPDMDVDAVSFAPAFAVDSELLTVPVIGLP